MPKISARARLTLTAERRKQILAAAAKVFAAKGFERATIAEIAKAAGVAEGSIYNYFKNKGDLLVSIPRQIIESPIAAVSERMSLLATAPLPPEQMLTLIARNLVNTVRQNAQVFRILISALPTMNKATREKYMTQVVTYAADTLEAYFNAQIEQGVFRRDAPAQVLTRAFIGMLFPFVMLREVLQVESETEWDYDQVIAAVVPLFLRGALAQPGSRAKKIPIE